MKDSRWYDFIPAFMFGVVSFKLLHLMIYSPPVGWILKSLLYFSALTIWMPAATWLPDFVATKRNHHHKSEGAHLIGAMFSLIGWAITLGYYVFT